MATIYRAPLRDMQFVVRELIDIDGIAALRRALSEAGTTS